MGIDVNLYVHADPNPERLLEAEAYFVARSDFGDAWGDPATILCVDNEEWFAQPRVVVSTLSMYYGPGYERGDWPRIYGAIRVLQAAFPGCSVFYGGDSTDDGIECTDEHLAKIWAHFLGPNGADYRSR